MAFQRLSVPAALAVTGALIVLVAAVAFWLMATRDRAPGFLWNRPPLSAQQYAGLCSRGRWACVDVPASGGEGIRLRGVVRPPLARGAPWLLFFPGNSTRLLSEGQQFLEAVAGADDIGLAVVAYRGYDGSPGQPSRRVLVPDASAVLRWLELGVASGSAVHLVAFSLGTLPALAAAVESQDDLSLRRAASLTLLAPYTRLRMLEPSWLPSALRGDEFNTLPFLPRVRIPVTVIHGGNDDTLSPAMGRAVSERLVGAARFLVLEGAGHDGLLEDPRAHEAVRAVVRGAR